MINVYTIKWCPTKESDLTESFPDLDTWCATYDYPTDTHPHGTYKSEQDLDEDQVDIIKEAIKKGICISIEAHEDQPND